jgi:hypothetical protein
VGQGDRDIVILKSFFPVGAVRERPLQVAHKKLFLRTIIAFDYQKFSLIGLRRARLGHATTGEIIFKEEDNF